MVHTPWLEHLPAVPIGVTNADRVVQDANPRVWLGIGNLKSHTLHRRHPSDRPNELQ